MFTFIAQINNQMKMILMKNVYYFNDFGFTKFYDSIHVLQRVLLNWAINRINMGHISSHSMTIVEGVSEFRHDFT